MACQSQRGLPLCPTNDHISSISASASPARSRFQATSAGFSVRSTAVFTDSSTGAFHIPSHLVVNQRTADIARSSRLDFPHLLDDCLPCGRRIIAKEPQQYQRLQILPLNPGESGQYGTEMAQHRDG